MVVAITIAFVGLFADKSATAQWEGREKLHSEVEKKFGPPDGATRLTPRDMVWVDRENHRVVVDGYVAIQEGQLEMFACPVFTKEHESVVAVFSKASTIHAALLAAGAKTGRPVQWEPEYKAPTGSEIQIEAQWTDREGKKQSIDARRWIRQVSSEEKHLEPNWVFAGSGFWEDPETKVKHYLAEAGDLVCVSNFTTAALDIPIKSTEANAGLLFVAESKRIPEPGTPIRLTLQVVQPEKEGSKLKKVETAESDGPKTEETKTDAATKP